MPEQREPQRRSREIVALAVSAAVILAIILAFFYVRADFGTAPDKPPPKESAATQAPYHTEPPAPNTTPPR